MCNAKVWRRLAWLTEPFHQRKFLCCCCRSHRQAVSQRIQTRQTDRQTEREQTRPVTVTPAIKYVLPAFMDDQDRKNSCPAEATDRHNSEADIVGLTLWETRMHSLYIAFKGVILYRRSYKWIIWPWDDNDLVKEIEMLYFCCFVNCKLKLLYILYILYIVNITFI